MKLNILKLQSGGGVGMLFSAVADPSSNYAQLLTTASSTSTESGSNGILSKEVLNKLRENGLPNEVDQFELILASVENKIATGRRVSSQEIARVRSMANLIIQQSNYLNKAIEFSEKHGALDDVAIDLNGYIFSLTGDGQIQKIAFDKFDPKKNQALTYSQLAEYRRNSPSLINNSDIIQTIGSGIGIEKINDFVLNILDKIGNTETKQEAYEQLLSIVGRGNAKLISAQEYEALRRMATAANLIGLDAIFKTTEYLKNDNVRMATAYIMSILPKNMKALLLGTFIANGGSYKDSRQYAAQIITLAANSAGSSSYQYGIDYQSGINTAAGNMQDKGKTANLTPLESAIYGTTNQTDMILASDKVPSVGLKLHGSNNAITDLEGKPVKSGPVTTEILDKGLGQLVDLQHVYLGSLKIDYSKLQGVYASTDNGMMTVWMPTDGSGNINWDVARKFNELLDYFDSNRSLTKQDKLVKLEELGINGYIDEQGNFLSTDPRIELFVILQGMTTDQVLGKERSQNLYANEVTGSKKSSRLDMIQKAYANSNHGRAKDGKSEFDQGWPGWNWTTDLYEVPIIMRVQRMASSNIGMMSGHGPTYKINTREELIIKQQERNPAMYSAGLLNN